MYDEYVWNNEDYKQWKIVVTLKNSISTCSRMASVIDRFKKKNKQPGSEWSTTGSFMHKPERGWIHPDSQLKPNAGVCYGVRYIGCLEVKESMKSLDFDTRTQLAREAISRVSEAAGLKNASKKRKVDKKINRMLGIHPGMQYAGSNVNLTITTDSLSLMVMESGDIIANHYMPGISFASGGDSETLDFVAYVAKDSLNNRACHVLECGGGLAEDVITTVGQAFELRFKEYLKRQPKAVTVPDRLNNISDGDAWGEDDEDYYNDTPGAGPPEPVFMAPAIPADYATPTSNLPVKPFNISLTPREGSPSIDCQSGNCNTLPNRPDSPTPGHTEEKKASSRIVAPLFDEWYHGQLSRKDAEKLLIQNGDFLVRQSSNDPNQFVLSGRENGHIKHLLLIDPQGVVRTKDHSFESVPHLIHFHQEEGLPIISQESEIFLVRPISNKYTNC
ncbi:hypothetical protein ScPMuIL_018525 [Solemya velum]